ncbi:hypothetical protein RND81_05G259900 [Saponaria officinalis]|uniref:Phosphoinositide phospholipase C n=1 Tax=Saponaria officinalis TaxID=3572 RepID=A0AAW1KX92_SAPOF
MEEFKRYLSSKSDHIKQSRQAYKFCFCFSRIFRLKMAEPPEDVVNVFRDYSDNGVMSAEQLYAFLKDYQGEERITITDAQDIFAKHLYIFQRGLNLNAFFSYLSGDLNPPISTEVHHNMTAPLAHYFLYTGHNSYLTGNQLSSNSSIDPIIRALNNGVRVIELDLWPSKKGDVEVCHGRTLTSSVKLSKCLQAIKDNAFKVSEFPVIITFEDHLENALLRKKVAEMVNATFGAMLYRRADFPEFPSPETLKGKILISTKPPESIDSHKDDEHEDLHKQEFNDKTVPIVLNEGDLKHESSAQTKVNNEVEEDDEDDGVVPEYRDLIAIRARKLKGELGNLLKDDSKGVGRLSMSEQRLQQYVKTYATDIVRFTQKNLLRVYPKGSRIMSSNYNPLTGWIHGAQMVAFNMQGFGKNLSIMQGMFRANGGCGYVKKPDVLLSNNAFSPSIKGDVKTILKVKVYMGEGWHLEFRPTHFDPLSPPDFFAKINVYGVPADMRKASTDPIEDQWAPVWNKEFRFPLTVPELALLRIRVLEHDYTRRHDFGGQTCLPVSELRSGIRAVPLYSKEGEKYKHVKLLINFQFLHVD